MSSIFYVMIIFPVILIGILGFVFSSSYTGLTNLEFLYNCPYPSQNQHATIGSPAILGGSNPSLNSVGGTYINYTLGARGTSVSNSTGTGQYFACYIQAVPNGVPSPAFNASQPNYGLTVVQFPVGWFAWVGDTGGAIMAKFGYAIQMGYAFITAPSQVTGLAFFNYFEAILVGFFILGMFMIVRGGLG